MRATFGAVGSVRSTSVSRTVERPGIGAIAAVSVATLAAFLATPLIGRILGKIGLSIIVRVLGLILCAMAVQFLLAGIADSTHGLIRPEAAAPYAK